MAKLLEINRSILIRSFRVGLVCWGVLILLVSGVLAGQFKENEIKAAFLYNLTNFIAWPQEAFVSPQSEFRLAILGKDRFGAILDQIVEGEKVQGKYPIVIHRIAQIDELDSCHLLYISPSAKEQWDQIFNITEGRTVLTVSDTPRFAHSGGMINLVRKAQRINIQINAQLVKQKGFTVSAKLLKLSTLVEN